MKINKITEIFNRFIRCVNDLEPIDNTVFSLDDFRKKISFSALDIEQLEEDYHSKSIQIHAENDEINAFFHTKLSTNEQTLHKELTLLKNNNIVERKHYDDELEQIKKNNINQFKAYEQNFIAKSDFLYKNKKNNKEEYILNVQKINQERTDANHNYQNTANDLDNRNEQINYDYNHALERYYTTYEINKANINKEFSEKNMQIDEKYNDDAEKILKEITIKKRQIVDGTIQYNSEINVLESETKRRLRYGFVPFDLENTQTNDEHDRKIQEYNQISENILSDFQTHLQKIDNQIQNLRKEQRENEFEYKQKIEKVRLEHNNETFKELNVLSTKINQLNNHYRKTKDEETEQQIKKLNTEKAKYIKSRKKLLSNQEQTIKNTYLEMELVYIEKIELLRCEKNKCEAIKSNAMKNLNAQKDIHMTEMNIKLQSIANNKESFEQIEQVEGNKKILEFRLNRDIDNAQIEYEINELERELKKIEFLRKKDKHHLKLEQQLQLDLLEINLEYQNKVLENRRNFSNISKMLEIQKNGLVKNFFNDISYQKIDYELAKYNFFNECDNLQYKIYKLEYDYQSKLLDEETNTAIKVAESKKQNVDSLSVHEEKIAQNYSLYRECMERISFYKERFNIEKKMIFDARNLFKATLKIIIGIENIVCKLLNSISKEYATRNYNVLSCLFEYIRDMKLSAITALFSNEIKVISTRIDFDKDLKYSRVIKALNEERDSYLKQLYDRYDKIEETINNYNSGIKIFEKNLANIKTEVEHYFIEIKHLSKNKDKASEMKILSLKKQINENDNKIKNIKIQINTNRLNIHNLEFSKFSIQREINKTNTKYEKQFNNIIRSQNKDAKIYNKTIQIIKRQYNQLKTVCIKQSYCFSKFKLTNLEILFNKLELSNSKIWELTKYYSELNTNSFNNAVSQELHSLNLNYHDSYERNDNQIYAAKIIDTNISKNRINEIIKTHNVKVLQLQKDHDEELNKLYTELNQLTSTHLKLTHQYDNQMKRAKLKHQHIVSCQQENYQKYEENYTDNTNNYREIFQQSNKDKKRKFKKNVEDLNQKLIAYEKNDHTRSTSNVLIKKNQIHDLKVIYQENLQKYNMQIKAINDKYHNLQVETNKLIKKNTESNYKNQKANRQEFELQIKLIEQRSRQKIIENQKKYLKKQQKK